MRILDNFLEDSTSRLARLIEDQDRLLEIVRNEKAELAGVKPISPSSLPAATQLRYWGAVD
jgi:hypothetical protein